MIIKKEYRIKFRNKFIVEGNLYGEFSTTYLKDNAMTFSDSESALLYVDTELKLNECNITLHKTTLIKTEEELVCVKGDWLPKSETEYCSHCLERFPKEELKKGVVDRETGLEFYCKKCHKEYDDKDMFIVGNQKLDEEVE